MTATLFDTNVLLWAVGGSDRLSRRGAAILFDTARTRLFSPLSIAEIAIKTTRGRPDFDTDPLLVRTKLLQDGLIELPLTGMHAARLTVLPPLHKDPFDRLMVAQALAEGIAFVTADSLLAGYPGQIVLV